MVKITAHAGCENTASGSRENLETAMRLGADMIEVDLRLNGDTLYLSHNPLDQGRLSNYVTFRQALELFCESQAEINCDLKEAECLKPAMALLREMGMETRAVFTGEVDEEAVLLPFRFFKNIEHYDFVGDGEQVTAETARQLAEIFRIHANPALDGFNIDYRTLSQEALRILLEQGVSVSCWQVDDEEDLRRFLQAQISYITTNALSLALNLRAACMDAAYEKGAMV